ncbi:aspartyl protease family protein 2 [Quillaja saponaria]|uniref:Aspartyl protease family protein 2 n=1 Tax=Quillaja saponaria TaxID=32244 RepID=A0AAD7L1E3_QUISA|nr:aspartyl protease family protein 2 [Quillaja saponaria]
MLEMIMGVTKMKKWRPISLIFITFFLFPIIIYGLNLEGKKGLNTMRVELVHRHDPRFNVNNTNKTQLERIKEFAHRDSIRYSMISQRKEGKNHSHDHRRKARESSFVMPIQGGRDFRIGEYFVQVKVGTPSQKFWLIADTGSDLIWFNCRYGCGRNCSTHKGRSKIKNRRVFLPERSATFEKVACSSDTCQVQLINLFSSTTCPNPSDPCQYAYEYVDQSTAFGFFANDVVTVGLRNGRKHKLRNMIIGCTQSITDGPTVNGGIDGVLGLSYSKDSFAVKAAIQYGGKFSYCLVDHLSHRNFFNHLSFGDDPVHHTKLLSHMRLTKLVKTDIYFAVNVLGISIGGQMLNIPGEVWEVNSNGGTILDSGTTLTILARPAYDSVMAALAKSLMKYERLPRSDALEFCFNAKGFDESSVPRLAIHFADGARFEPPVKSYVIDSAPGERCLGFLPANGPGYSIIGNIMQQNHLWEFDLFQSTVRFAPSSCIL